MSKPWTASGLDGDGESTEKYRVRTSAESGGNRKLNLILVKLKPSESNIQKGWAEPNDIVSRRFRR